MCACVTCVCRCDVHECTCDVCVCTYACVCISRMCLCAPVFDVNGISLMVEERASARVSQR